MRRHIIIALITGMLGTACHRIDSENIPTDAVKADIQITAHELGATSVKATLKLENEALTYLQLSPGERLTASVDGIDTVMFPSSFSYYASLPNRDRESLFRIGFERTRFGSAPDSFVMLPRPFNLYVFGETDGRSDQIAVEWDVLSSDPMRIRIDGPCMHPYEYDIAPFEDDGLHIVPLDHLPVFSRWSGGRCHLEISVERSRSGELDPALSGGSITAIQSRTDYMDIWR